MTLSKTKNYFIFLLLVSTSLSMVSCGHNQIGSKRKNSFLLNKQGNNSNLVKNSKSGLLSESMTDSEADESAEDQKEVEQKKTMPITLNPLVQQWIEYFTSKDKDRFQRFLDRGHYYRDVVQTVLEENELPYELFYLAMIESGYTPHAYSRAKAVGVWQFIQGTAKRYGLRVDNYLDERRDPIRATESAAKYLSDLYNVFNSWELAMAAYNCGEVCVLRAIMNGKTRDFWELVAKGLLPQETRHYVPKFMAAALIGQDPEKFGLKDPTGSAPSFPSVEAVLVPSPIRLKELSSTIGVDEQTLLTLNPHLRKGITPPGHSHYEVWVPKANSAKVAELEPQLVQMSKAINPKKIEPVVAAPIPSAKEVASIHDHVVRKGETLSSIAKKYSISLTYLKRLNGLKRNRIHPGVKLRVSARQYQASGPKHYYRVRNGDTLDKIARRYGISVRDLKKSNRLHTSRIKKGQKILIPVHLSKTPERISNNGLEVL